MPIREAAARLPGGGNMFRLLTSVLLFGLTLNVSTSFAGGSHQSLAQLNSQLMTLNAQTQRGDAAARADAMNALLSVATAREQQLAALIADHPDVVLRNALSAEARNALPSAVQAHVEEQLSIEGELEVLHEDGPGGSRYHYALNHTLGQLALFFAADAPVLQTGDRVRVSGVRVQNTMALSSGGSNVTTIALASPNTFGEQKTAVILVNFQDDPTRTWVSPAQAYSIVFGTSNA